MLTLCVAQEVAVDGGEERTHVACPAGGVAGEGAHVGEQQEVWQMWADRTAGHRLLRSGAWNSAVGDEGRSDFGGDARAQERYEGVPEGRAAPCGHL